MPSSPSMYVILDSQDAVDIKPGSNVKHPVSLYRDDTSSTSGPCVPLWRLSVLFLDVALSCYSLHKTFVLCC